MKEKRRFGQLSCFFELFCWCAFLDFDFDFFAIFSF